MMNEALAECIFEERLSEILVSSHKYPGMIQTYLEVIGVAFRKWDELP